MFQIERRLGMARRCTKFGRRALPGVVIDELECRLAFDAGAVALSFNNGRPVYSTLTVHRGSDHLSDNGLAAVFANNGDLIVVGVAGYLHSIGPSQAQAGVVAYTPSGGLDDSFAGTGMLKTRFGTKLPTYLTAVAIQPVDEKILIAGAMAVQGGTAQEMVVARLRTDGKLDPSFGLNGSGFVQIPFGQSSSAATAISVQSDGKILVAGTRADSGGSRFALARLNSDGSLDKSFGTAGEQASVHFGVGPDSPKIINITSGGEIAVAGVAGRHMALALYSSRGTLDPNFAGDGWVILPQRNQTNSAIGLSGLQDGSFLVVGSASVSSAKSELLLCTVSATGLTNGVNAFGTNNGVELTAAAFQKDGEIVVAGHSTVAVKHEPNNEYFVLSRYLSDGELDSNFGAQGSVVSKAPHASEIRSILLSNNLIGVAGSGRAQNTDSLQFYADEFTNDVMA